MPWARKGAPAVVSRRSL